MSKYAYLSKLDPEFSALLEQCNPPTLTPPVDIVAAQQDWIKHGQAPYAAYEKARLCPDAKYRVQDYKVPVEGGRSLSSSDNTECRVSVQRLVNSVAPGHLFPTQLNDSFSALKWAVANVDALSVSLKKGFILGGCSAGGTLAAGLSIRVRGETSFSDTPVTGLYLAVPLLVHVDAYSQFPNELLSLEQNKDGPFLTKELLVWTFKIIGASSPTDPEISPVLATSHANLPPTFFQICGLDPLRDDAFLYDRLLREARCKTNVKMSHPTLKASEQYRSDVRTGLRWLLNGGSDRCTTLESREGTNRKKWEMKRSRM
ncbi:alpha/beta hydrolase fold-domain-containing protein [Lactarius quietus]|nr:alpha/beta hydrolase fold-domain-containing protein [Lactarius quietus]